MILEGTPLRISSRDSSILYGIPELTERLERGSLVAHAIDAVLYYVKIQPLTSYLQKRVSRIPYSQIEQASVIQSFPISEDFRIDSAETFFWTVDGPGYLWSVLPDQHFKSQFLSEFLSFLKGMNRGDTALC